MTNRYMQVGFTFWSISESLKKLLINDEKWSDYFATDPEVLSAVLATLCEQIKSVDLFSSIENTNQFFDFLKALLESKPQSERVLNEFSAIRAVILDKISAQDQLDAGKTNVAIQYLDLFSLMLEPNYRALFNQTEISSWTDDFQTISQVHFNSQDLLSQFRSTLLSGFQCDAFIEKYPVLLQIITELALSIEKNQTDSNALSAMKLFDTLGTLDHSLKSSEIAALNQSEIDLSIQETRNLLYEQFQPFVKENFLQYIVYKSFLSQSYKDSGINLTQLCESDDYQAQCQSDYLRFQDSYNCSPGRLSDFSIVIRNNNVSTIELDQACKVMRDVEFFFTGMKDHGFIPRYNTSEYLLYLAASRNDFLIDKFLYERSDVLNTYTVMGTYFQSDEIPMLTGSLSGKTYTYTMAPAVITHEYVHHLYAFFVKDLEFDLTTTEGVAELFAGGVCSPTNIRDLRNFVNDTSIFNFFQHRKYPFYFNALKWVAYLAHEQLSFFKTLLGFLQEGEKESFYLAMDTFIANATNIEAFVAWSNQQVNTCNEYLRIFPEGHQPPILYLDIINRILNCSRNTVSPSPELTSRQMVKRDLSLFYSKPDLNNTDLVIYSEKHKSYSEAWLKMMSLPMSALMGGFLSANLDHIGEISQEKYPSLPAYIHCGFKPLLFALISSGFNQILLSDQEVEEDKRFAQFFAYFIFNFIGVVLAQPLTQKIAETIHNKLLSFLVQSLTWTLLWNPSLFASEYTEILPVMCIQLLQGLCFKVGEEGYTLAKKSYNYSSSFWYKNALSDDKEQVLNNGEIKRSAQLTFGQSSA